MSLSRMPVGMTNTCLAFLLFPSLASCEKQHSPYEVDTQELLSKFLMGHAAMMGQYQEKKLISEKAKCMRNFEIYIRTVRRTIVPASMVPQKYKAVNRSIGKVLMRHEELAYAIGEIHPANLEDFDREFEKASAELLRVVEEFHRLRDQR